MKLQEALTKACQLEVSRYQSYINTALATKEVIPDLPDVDGVEHICMGLTNLELYCGKDVDVHRITEELRRALHIPTSRRSASDGKIHTEMVLNHHIGTFTKILIHGWPGETCRVEKRLVGTRVVEEYEYKVICGEKEN